jgi:predicted nucleotidyltransferase
LGKYSTFVIIFGKKEYLCAFKKNVMKIETKIDNIRDTILKFVPARCIYLFGSYAYGEPTENSDIDIFVVMPDDEKNFTQFYTKVISDLSYKDIFFIDLSFDTESSFHERRLKRKFERTIYQQGRILYEQ